MVPLRRTKEYPHPAPGKRGPVTNTVWSTFCKDPVLISSIEVVQFPRQLLTYN
jgi:hypothetical protein